MGQINIKFTVCLTYGGEIIELITVPLFTLRIRTFYCARNVMANMKGNSSNIGLIGKILCTIIFQNSAKTKVIKT